MEKDIETANSQPMDPLLNLQSEALSAASLKQFYDNNRTAIDLNNDGFVLGDELNKFKTKFNPISRQYRLAETLAARLPEIQVLSRDERGWFDWVENKGISSKDMIALDEKVSAGTSDPLIKTINEGLAACDYENLVRNAQELNEDRLHLVNLKLKKSSFSLDPMKHLGNELKASTQTTLVGERQYHKFKVGETLSNRGDGVGFFFNGELASYSVSVGSKRIETAYSWVDSERQTHPLSPNVFKELKTEIARHGRTMLETPYAGSTRTYLTDKPISEMNIVDRQEMKRYFVDVEIKNSSLSLDLIKQLRNATTTHRLELEVPENVYSNTKSIWNPKLNGASMVLGGRFSSMKGEVKRKWTEVDPNYEQISTDEKRTFVVPFRITL